MLFAAPYAVFIAVVFAYPLGFAVWMSSTTTSSPRPGSSVPHPFVGLDNYTTVLTDPGRAAVVPATSVIFLVINVPLTVVLSLVLAVALNRAIRVPDLLPGRLLRART